MSKMHTYAPPTVEVATPGDGNKLIVGTWPDGETVVLVLAESTAKTIGEMLLAPSVLVTGKLPPTLNDGRNVL